MDAETTTPEDASALVAAAHAAEPNLKVHAGESSKDYVIVLVSNLDLETKILGNNDESVPQLCIGEEETDNKHNRTEPHAEEEIKEKRAGMSSYTRANGKPESIRSTNKSDNYREDKHTSAKTEDSSIVNVASNSDGEATSKNRYVKFEGLPLVESTTKNEIKEIKFPQKNGNDVNSKYPLAEETRKPDHGKTDEVTETRSQEIYQESSKVCMESEKQVEHQPEGYSMENKIFKQTDSEGQVMMETIPKSSEPEDETMPSLLTLAINQGEVAEKSFEIETNEEEESTTIYDDQSCRPQNELEQMNKAIDLTQFVGKDVAENEHTDENFEAPNMDNEITKHFNSEGKLNMESTIKSSYNVEERTPESHSSANSEIKDDGKTMPEKATDIKEAIEVEQQKSETESVPEDKSLSTLATTAPIMVEAVEESIQEDIHQEESPMTDTEERHKTENGFEKKTAPKVFDLHEGISNNCMEDEKKAQHRSEAQSMETMAIMHANLKGLGSTDISLRNNTEELEEDPASQTKQKLEMDGQNIMPEEEKEMLLKNEATDMQLLKSETESVREDECMEKESTAKENKDSGPENEHKQMTKVLEAIENPKPMVKIDTETEENADHLSEASIIKNVIIKHINIKGKERKSSTKSSYEMDEVEESPESHSVNSAETKEVDKITPEEAIDIKEATNMELQKSATESNYVLKIQHPSLLSLPN
ncbi:hypothetical protein VNO77_20247 [Canavalia gladiata]|uniref:Uncharacterized protein n=1 Tax=Canavalia gladiata TaxID=3824 RepID=A0AAN9LNX3_CANGL